MDQRPVFRVNAGLPLLECVGQCGIVVAELTLPLRRKIDCIGGEIPIPDADVRPLHRHCEAGLAGAQGFLRLFPLGNIHDEGCEGIGIFQTERGDREFDRKFRAISAQRANFDSFIEDRSLAGFEELPYPSLVSLSLRGRNNGLCHQATDGFLARPPECLLRLRVPADNASLLVDADD